VNDKLIYKAIANYFKTKVINNKGTITSFTPRHITNTILTLHNLKISPRVLNSRIRNILEKLVDLKLIKIWKKCARGKIYVIDVLDSRNRMLYEIIRTLDIDDLATFLEKIYRIRNEEQINKLLQEITKHEFNS